MAAMEIFVRHSMPSIPISIQEDDDSLWSWRHIKEKFRVKEAETLFHKYQARLQHALFVLMLLLNLFQGTASLLVYFIFAEDLNNVNVSLILRGISMSIYLALLCTSHNERWFRPDATRIFVSCALLFTMLITSHGSLIYMAISTGKCESGAMGIRPTYYIILLIHVMFPFPHKWQCAIAGFCITAFELLLTGICRKTERRNVPYLLASDAVFYLVGGMVGLCIRFLMELMNRRAFLDRRDRIESKMKLDLEKEQEEKLLLSVIPKHIVKQVKEGIRIAMDQKLFQRRPFNQLYIERHKSVSILYADIVNSMKLAANLTARELVETLDELFARFDECAETNDCLRVKLLGDCYYCVSGMPDGDLTLDDNSVRMDADNCVRMGLAMIDIIRNVRLERQVDVDMRIGVHSGRVLCGLLGLNKWQYDIWSKDVSIASHMEQTGKPGHVHITEATYCLLQDNYPTLYCVDVRLRDSFLRAEHIDATYLICPEASELPLWHHRRSSFYEVAEVNRGSQSNVTPGIARSHRMSRKSSYNSGDILSSRRRAVLDYSLRQYRQMVCDINKDMDFEIERMALSKKDQWCHPERIHPLFLTFQDKGYEWDYQMQPDPLVKYYMLCVLFIFMGTAIIHILVIPWNAYLKVIYGVTLVIILLGNAFTWAGYLWTLFTKEEVRSRYHLLSHQWNLIRASRLVNKSLALRLSLWLLSASLMLSVAMLGLDDCKIFPSNSIIGNNTIEITAHNHSSASNFDEHNTMSCRYPWYFTFSAVLAMTTTSVFLKVHYWLKLTMHICGTALFSSYIVNLESEVFKEGKSYFTDWHKLKETPLLSHCFFVITFALTLHMLDRQVEYMCRVNYISERRLREEQEEAKTMGVVNRVLLTNILPLHVAQLYLDQELGHTDDLYCEEYEHVAVMFASLPEFMDFYTENMINEEGLKCLQLLNEIICDFDELIYTRPFSKVEKIKTIGSTYMAASGLLPGRNSIEDVSEEDGVVNVVTMVKFATAMMEKLAHMNRDAQQDMRLRIGIAMGPVIAGVVGAGKPQYDIWGDTVNTASRMDSTGVVGRIHVTEEVAKVLESSRAVDCNENPFRCESRGLRFVKGKGMLTTYLVFTPFDNSHLETTKL